MRFRFKAAANQRKKGASIMIYDDLADNEPRSKLSLQGWSRRFANLRTNHEIRS